jgi:hypothetical protein
MLARFEKALSTQVEAENEAEMRAIHCLLDGLIDYAGLYPPAGLDMQSAVRNYLDYRQGRYEYALGSFVVDLNRVEEVRDAAGKSVGQMKLSVIASPATDWSSLPDLIDSGLPIELLEIRPARPVDVMTLEKRVPAGVAAYFEVPIEGQDHDILDAIAAAGGRAKLRMGGVVSEAFPPAGDVAKILKEFAVRKISFKATAGLHHPIRSRHHFTYEPDSPSGMMHGFVNLFFAAAMLYFGGDVADAERLLSDEDITSWEINEDAIRWNALSWPTTRVREVRQKFMNSFGSCSFVDPLRDLEMLGWL